MNTNLTKLVLFFVIALSFLISVSSVFAIDDTTPPVIATHEDVFAEATSASGAIVTYTSPTTTDDVDTPGVAICLPASDSEFALGDTMVTCDATDTAGNQAIPTTFTVTVVDTPPIITLTGDFEVTVEGGSEYKDAGATATDAVDGDLTNQLVVSTPIDTNVVGDYTVTYDVTDSSGNAADQVTRTVHVVDATHPEIDA